MTTKAGELDEARRYSNIGRLLLNAFREFDRRVVAEIRAGGFSDFRSTDAAMLRNLELGGTRISTIAARANVTKQAAGQQVASLARRGYVRARADPTDGRAKLVELTAQGRRLISVGQQAYVRLERQWETDLGAEELERLRAALLRIAARDDEG